MKKLEKLKINPDRVIKSEELVKLKGGNGGQTTFFCKYGSIILGCVTEGSCDEDAAYMDCLTEVSHLTDTVVYSCGVSFTCEL